MNISYHRKYLKYKNKLNKKHFLFNLFFHYKIYRYTCIYMYRDKYLKYKNKYLNLKGGSKNINYKRYIFDDDESVVKRPNTRHILRFSQQVAHKNDNLIEYTEENANIVITKKLNNSIGLQFIFGILHNLWSNLQANSLNWIYEPVKAKKQLEKQVNIPNIKDNLIINWIVIKILKELKPMYDQLYILGNKVNEKEEEKKGKDIKEIGMIDTEINKIIEESEEIYKDNDYESLIHSIFFKKKEPILQERIINATMDAIELILNEEWLLNDFNKGNIVFYTDDDVVLLDAKDIDLDTVDTADVELDQFFNENLKVMLIDWKYVKSPEENKSDYYATWDWKTWGNKELKTIFANNNSMRNNIISNSFLFGNIEKYLLKFDEIIEKHRKQLIIEKSKQELQKAEGAD